MPNYVNCYGEYMEPKWLIFGAEKREQLYPFEEWAKTGKHKTKNYETFLDWRSAYNKIKLIVTG